MPKQNKVNQKENSLYTFSLPDTSVLLSALGLHEFLNVTFLSTSLTLLCYKFYRLKGLTLLGEKCCFYSSYLKGLSFFVGNISFSPF